MRFHRSLRSRAILTFCVFSAVLGVAHSLSSFAILNATEQGVFLRRLQSELEHFLTQYEVNPRTPLPSGRFFSSYLGPGALPSPIAARVGDATSGFFEVRQRDGFRAHVAVATLPDSNTRLYLVYDVSTLGPLDQEDITLGLMLGCVALLMTLIGGWLGYLTAGRMVAPVVRLADLVRSARSLEDLPRGFSRQFVADEVGLLARTLESGIERLRAFMDREQRFTRDASHELRTPVTVAKGALELLGQLPAAADASLQRPLRRISRAVADMENNIETFLWLGREPDEQDRFEPCLLTPVVDKAIQQQRYLLENREVEVRVPPPEPLRIEAPRQALYITVSNLIRNAFQHTRHGSVTVQVLRDAVVVQDTGPGIPEAELQRIRLPHVRGAQSKGYGLGLDIVQRLCQRFGWHFDLESTPGVGTRAMIRFAPDAPEGD